ncbi:MAG: hypothetical protein ACOZAO_01160 [Patescibacteria group bacterium]
MSQQLLVSNVRFNPRKWHLPYGSKFNGSMYLHLPIERAMAVAGKKFDYAEELNAFLESLGLEKMVYKDAIFYHDGKLKERHFVSRTYKVHHGWQIADQEGLFLRYLPKGYAVVEIEYGWNTLLSEGKDRHYGRTHVVAVKEGYGLQLVLQLGNYKKIRVRNNKLETANVGTSSYRAISTEGAPNVEVPQGAFLLHSRTLKQMSYQVFETNLTKKYKGDDWFLVRFR